MKYSHGRFFRQRFKQSLPAIRDSGQQFRIRGPLVKVVPTLNVVNEGNCIAKIGRLRGIDFVDLGQG